MTMSGRAYGWITTAAGPLVRLYLKRRRSTGKEHPTRFAERLGHPGRARPAGRVLWVHGASVGESLSALPLVERLLALYPSWHVVMTSGTVTSARLLSERLPARALHQFVPVDRMPWVRRFLDHWRPDAAIWLESELWPNLIAETHRRAIPMALVNGRLSDTSLRLWQWFPVLMRTLLSAFSIVLAQSEDDKARLRQLGADGVRCLGNLKQSSPPLPVDETALALLRDTVGERPCWLAASTHPGEENAVWRVHQHLSKQIPALLTIVAPRHPHRGPGVAEDLAAAGARVAVRSSGRVPDANTTLYVADTLGELGLFYRLCPLVFVGKSLPCPNHPGGGQNPWEPARLGAAVVFGPCMENFSLIAETMIAQGAARQVSDGADLAETIGWLLRDRHARRVMGEAGLALAQSETAVVERVAQALAPLFDGAFDVGAPA